MENRFYSIVSISAAGAHTEARPLDVDAALEAAMALADAGYRHIRLCDVVTGEELNFTAPRPH